MKSSQRKALKKFPVALSELTECLIYGKESPSGPDAAIPRLAHRDQRSDMQRAWDSCQIITQDVGHAANRPASC